MLLNSQVRFMIEETIHHMWGVASGGTDHFHAVGTILIGKMGIKADSRLSAIAQVHLCYWTSPATDLKALPIRRGCGAIAPGSSKGMAMMIIDNLRQSLG